jgi:nucleotide-binding universal stress UspA family protein
MMTSRILCGIDGEEHSVRAAGVAFDLAKKLSAELYLCMVNPVLRGRMGTFCWWPDGYVEKILGEMVCKAGWSGLPSVKYESLRAISVADAIVAYADEHQIDYIIVGARECSRFLRSLGGSASKEISCKAKCPVLIVRRIREQQRSRLDRGFPEVTNTRSSIGMVGRAWFVRANSGHQD